MSIFPRFFGFIAVSGISQRWEFKNIAKNFLQKQSCRKVLQKNRPKITKNPKPTFSRFFHHVFGRFSVRGVQKHHKKYRENKSDPGVTEKKIGGPLTRSEKFRAPFWVFLCVLMG
jgi:hypothetical protein